VNHGYFLIRFCLLPGGGVDDGLTLAVPRPRTTMTTLAIAFLHRDEALLALSPREPRSPTVAFLSTT
jgi:hypothetical protein